jgi:hypothetical protein
MPLELPGLDLVLKVPAANLARIPDRAKVAWKST